MEDTNRGGTFSGGVVALFGTQVVGAALGVLNGILLARLLGPAAKGDYYIIVLLPATALTLLQLGLPQAFGFFAARGQTRTILTKALALTTALSLAAFAVMAAVVPVVHDEALGTIGVEQIAFAFLGFPLALHAMFTTGIVMGRQAVRWYAAVNIACSILGTVLLVAVLGGIGASVNTALAVYVISIAIQAVGFAIAAVRVCAANEGAGPVTYRDLFGYGLPFYPGSLATFFSYRVDAYLIAFLIADPSEPLGYYSMAVGLAEMVFFFPRAVSTLFFPHVASSAREDADRQVALVSRVTLLVTGAFAILLVPAATVMILLVLPAFVPSLAPLVVLLPGVVALSATYVLSGYFRGIGRPGITSTVSIASLAVNVVANLVLIPRFGIVGASAASLVSYSLTSLALSVMASRATGLRVIDFWVPRPSDVRFVARTSIDLVRRLATRPRPVREDGGA